MQAQLTKSTTGSLKQFIPQSPATNIKTKEISRWQQRESKNANQMNLLSNIESYFQEEPKVIHATPQTAPEQARKKTFLRKGSGTVTQTNKYQLEREKQAERKRMLKLGINNGTKPKTQKIIFMEQWREKQKKKEKLLRKKKEQRMHHEPPVIHPPKTAKSSLNAIKLLKQKKKMKHVPSAPQMEIIEQKTPSDELQSASQFEEAHFDEAVLVKTHDNEQKIDQQHVENTQHLAEIGIWSKPKLPKKINMTHRAQKGPNFARHSALSHDRPKKQAYAKYSHHHHTSLYGSRPTSRRKNHEPNTHKYVSEHKKLFHKQATIHSMSKRDRLAAKYNDRKAAEPQINAEKAYLAKMEEMQQTIEKYEAKIADAQLMKQSSLEQYRKYQSLVQDKTADIDQRRRDFEKYKKKQERILAQKTQEIDKRSRALLNIPDRKQRKQIEELKKEINDLKLEFIEKEKRYKSKLERLKKQNKKVSKEKTELQNEMKKFEKERLEIWQKQRNLENDKEKKQNQVIRKKKKYAINKIDVNHNRPRSHHGVIRRSSFAGTASNVNRSTNQIYAAPQQQPQHYAYDTLSTYEDEHEYESTSSESSSSSDESTKNGEDPTQHQVLVDNQNIQNVELQKENVDTNNVSIKQSAFVDLQNENECCLPNVPPEYDPSKMSTEQINCESVQNTGNPIERMQHPDGKIEQVYRDGSKLILFPNQTEKYIFGNLSTNDKQCKQVYVKFPNGDVKKILADGAEVYYYSDNDIIHASKPDGMQLFFFSSQHEVHFPDNTKHILFADGTKKYIYPNGEEQCVFPQTDST